MTVWTNTVGRHVRIKAVTKLDPHGKSNLTTSSSSADQGFGLCPVVVHFVQPKDKNLKIDIIGKKWKD